MRLLYLRGITRLLGLCLVINNAAVLVEAAATPAASATCTVTAYTDVASATASCTSIVLQSIAVPAQKTLDLSKLKTGTTVTFSGKTVSQDRSRELVLAKTLDIRLLPMDWKSDTGWRH